MSDTFMDWWNSKGIELYGNRESYELCFAAGRASVEENVKAAMKIIAAPSQEYEEIMGAGGIYANAPSQEPVAWVKCNDESDVTFQKPVSEAGYIRLYTHPSDAAAQIAELEQRVGWCNAELNGKDEQIAKLQEENTSLRRDLAAMTEVADQWAMAAKEAQHRCRGNCNQGRACTCG
jgi:hypothetical protein